MVTDTEQQLFNVFKTIEEKKTLIDHLQNVTLHKDKITKQKKYKNFIPIYLISNKTLKRWNLLETAYINLFICTI